MEKVVKSWGGIREGAGRPKGCTRFTQAFSLSKPASKLVNAESKRLGISKSAFVDSCVLGIAEKVMALEIEMDGLATDLRKALSERDYANASARKALSRLTMKGTEMKKLREELAEERKASKAKVKAPGICCDAAEKLKDARDVLEFYEQEDVWKPTPRGPIILAKLDWRLNAKGSEIGGKLARDCLGHEPPAYAMALNAMRRVVETPKTGQKP